MKNPNKNIIKAFGLVLVLTMLLLTSCNTNTPVTACHATGDQDNPYEEISIDSTNAKEHLGHPNDIYPVPVGGCPSNLVDVDNNKITICHSTGNENNPYNEITVSINGLNGHDDHVGDIIPAPVGGCPTSPLEIVEDTIMICHATDDETVPYEEIKVKTNGLDGHVSHENDIIPAPVDGCPTSPLVIIDGKITICHATSSETNPYNEITVSVNGLNGHVTHEGDIIPAPVGGCPTSPLVIVEETINICHATDNESVPYEEINVKTNGMDGHVAHEKDIIPAPIDGCPTSPLVIKDGKITICHATSSKKNSYNEIRISVNGLNGHDKHEDDLIPSPMDGCPTSKQ